jgi:putative SOS response-associated peptidase YedK
MCNLYSITTNQAAMIALFRVVNRYVGNLAPMAGVFPDYPAPVIRNTDSGTELARLAEAGEPLPGPVQQLRRIRAGAEPGDEEKGRGLVLLSTMIGR